MSTTTIIWTGDSANAPSTINNLYGIDAYTAKRLVDALNNGGASLSFEIRSDGHLWQVNTATGEAKDMGQVVPTTGEYVDGTSDPIVIGKGAAVGGNVTNTIVIGKGSAVGDYVSNSVNIGTGMGLAKGANDRIIIGSGSSAYGDDSVAIGSPATVSDSESVAIGGAHASASGAHSIAIGSDCFSVGAYATGVGSNSAAQAEGAVALGGSTSVTASHAVALGDDSEAGEAYTVSVGTDKVKRRIVNVGEPVASADAATKSYVDTAGRGWSPVIVGSGASIDGGNPNTQTVVGVGAQSNKDRATAVGASATASGDKSTAVGASATVSGAQSDALGASSSVSGASSVALGFGSVASDNSVVSVGSGVATESYGKRRIVNVADPTGDSDAATKGYVDKAVGSGSSYTLPPASASTLGGVKVGSGLTVADDGTLSATGGSGSGSAYTLQPATTSTLGGVKVGTGLTVTDDGTLSGFDSKASDVTIGGDASVQSTGGENIAIGPRACCGYGSRGSLAVGSGAGVGIKTSGSTEAVAIGNSAKTDTGGDYSVAIGSGSYTSYESVAIGYSASIRGSSFYSVAIGAESSVSYYNASYAVALGADSKATVENTVSVGNDTRSRRIMHVAGPEDAQDAVTKSYADIQVKLLQATIEKLTGATYTPVTGVSVTAASTNVKKGGTVQLTATVTPSTATNTTVAYAVQESDLGTVDDNGLFTASSENTGTAHVTAYAADGQSASVTITVS